MNKSDLSSFEILFLVLTMLIVGVIIGSSMTQNDFFMHGTECQKAVATLQTSADTLDFYRLQSDMCVLYLEKGEV